MLPKTMFLMLLAPMLASAQMPLSIEELLIDQDVLKLETSFSYASSARTVQHLQWISADQSPDQSPLPITRIARRDSDATQMVAGLRYGLSARAELNVRARYAYFTSTEPPVNGSRSVFNDSGYVQAVTLGGSWLASPENDSPALLLSLSLDAMEKGSGASSQALYAKAGRVGVTAYTSIDPVVLSVVMGYEFSASRTLGKRRLDPGNEFFLLPQLNFAVNHKVTLIGGIGLRIREVERIDGRRVTSRSSSTQTLVGLGFAPSADSTVFVQSRFSTGGERSANISIDWLYQF